MVKKSIGYLWRFVLVLAVATFFVPAASVWSTPEECVHTAEYWEEVNKEREANIEKLRQNLIPSRNAHTSRIQANSFTSGRLGAYSDSMMKTLADPNFLGLPPNERRARMDSNMLLDQQGHIDPFGTPHKAGANSLRENQRQNREIPGLMSQIAATEAYIKRCFVGAYYQTIDVGGTHTVTAWNCSGLTGLWHFEIDHISDAGDFQGQGSFTVPPRPASGQWLTPAFSYVATGLKVYDPVTWTEYLINMDGVVMEVVAGVDDTTPVNINVDSYQSAETHSISHFNYEPYTAEISFPGPVGGGLLGGVVSFGNNPKCP